MYTLLINDQEVPVTGAKADVVVNSPKVQAWAKTFDRELCVTSIEVQSTTIRNGRLLFATLAAQVTKDGKPVPGIATLRGGTATIFPVIKVGRKLYTVLAGQARFPVGKAKLAETLAGMLDDTGDFIVTAVKEVFEESGLKTTAAELIPLGSFYTSPGLLDEEQQIFAFESELSAAELDGLRGKLMGLAEENETICLEVCELDEVPQKAGKDAKTMLAYLLWKERCRNIAA